MANIEIMGFYKDFIDGLKSCIGDGRRFKSNKDLAVYCGVQPTQTARYVNGTRKTHLIALGKIIDSLGAKLLFQEENFDNKFIDICNENLNLHEKIRLLEEEIEKEKKYRIDAETRLDELRNIISNKLGENKKEIDAGLLTSKIFDKKIDRCS